MKQYQVLNHIKLLAHYKNKEKCANHFVETECIFKSFLYMCVPIIMCVCKLILSAHTNSFGRFLNILSNRNIL